MVAKKMNFYSSTDILIDTGTQNDNLLLAFSKAAPPPVVTPYSGSLTANTTKLITAEIYGPAFDNTSVHAGTWQLETIAAVNSIASNRKTYLMRNFYEVKQGTGTITASSTGGTRTFTASTGTPFTTADDSSDLATCGYIQTPHGLFPITSFSSSTVVDCATPTTYTNESTVAYKVWKLGQTTRSALITAVYPIMQHVINTMVAPAVSVTATSEFGMIAFANSTDATTLYLTQLDENDVIPSAVLWTHLEGTRGNVTDKNYVTNGQLSALEEPYAKGDIAVCTGDGRFARLPVGTNGQYLTASSSTATGLLWATHT